MLLRANGWVPPLCVSARESRTNGSLKFIFYQLIDVPFVSGIKLGAHMSRRQGWVWSIVEKKMKKCTQRSRDKSSMMKTFRIPTRLSCSYFHNRATLSLFHIYPPTAKKKKTEREKDIHAQMYLSAKLDIYEDTVIQRIIGLFWSNVNCKTVSLFVSRQHAEESEHSTRTSKSSGLYPCWDEESSKAPPGRAFVSWELSRAFSTVESSLNLENGSSLPENLWRNDIMTTFRTQSSHSYEVVGEKKFCDSRSDWEQRSGNTQCKRDQKRK